MWFLDRWSVHGVISRPRYVFTDQVNVIACLEEWNKLDEPFRRDMTTLALSH